MCTKPWTILGVLALVAYGLVAPSTSYAAPTYEIESAGNDEKFVIDSELYSAKTYCLGWDVGDDIVFVDGTPGVCTSATLYNKSKRQTCDVWCE
jgi:hypothetical protein